MTAVSSSSVATVSNVGGWPPIACAERLGAVDRATSAAGSAVIIQKCSQPVGLLEAGVALLADRQLGGALEAEVGLRVGVAEVVGHLAPLSSTLSGTTVPPALRMPK